MEERHVKVLVHSKTVTVERATIYVDLTIANGNRTKAKGFWKFSRRICLVFKHYFYVVF